MANKSSASASGSGKKRKASDDGASGKKCQAISFETKVAIIKKLVSNEKLANVAQFFINYPHLVLHLLCRVFFSFFAIYVYIRGIKYPSLLIIGRKLPFNRLTNNSAHKRPFVTNCVCKF